MADLTVGMATFDDYDGVYFTIQAIRTYHLEVECHFVVVDNHPDGKHGEALRHFANSVPGLSYVPFSDWQGTAIKNLVFQHAQAERVLCLDCHVLLLPGSLAGLLHRMTEDRTQQDLFQGPLVYDDLVSVSTHFEPGWRGGMYGTWATDPRGIDTAEPPFEIPMQGCGLMACHRAAWPGFNPRFRGFGAEEWYIHEKTRQRGGRVWCLPALRWMHRFGRPGGPPFQNTWEARIRNYLIGWDELGLATEGIHTHFDELLAQPGFTQRVADQLEQEKADG